MMIHATPHACFVILNNGLTLELFYDEALTGSGASGGESYGLRRRAVGSHGVWLLGEDVVSEVRAGQA